MTYPRTWQGARKTSTGPPKTSPGPSQDAMNHPPLRNFPGPCQDPPKPCHQGTCYPATSHSTLSFQQPATCIRSTWHEKWPGGMREAFKSATPWRARGEGVLNSLQALLLNRKSPIPISISNLKFQSQFPIHLNFHSRFPSSRVFQRDLKKRLASPLRLEGVPPPPSGRAHSAGSDHSDHPHTPFWLQNR